MKFYQAILYRPDNVCDYHNGCTSSDFRMFSTYTKDELFNKILPVLMQNFIDYRKDSSYADIETILSINGHSEDSYDYGYNGVEIPEDILQELRSMRTELAGLETTQNEAYIKKLQIEAQNKKRLAEEQQEIRDRKDFERLSKKYEKEIK